MLSRAYRHLKFFTLEFYFSLISTIVMMNNIVLPLKSVIPNLVASSVLLGIAFFSFENVFISCEVSRHNAPVIGFHGDEGEKGGTPAYLGKCGYFEINTSPCSGGNMVKYRYTVLTPGVNTWTIARQWRLGMFFFWLIEEGGSNWRLHESIYLVITSALLNHRFDLSLYCCFFANFRLHCSIFRWVHSNAVHIH